MQAAILCLCGAHSSMRVSTNPARGSGTYGWLACVPLPDVMLFCRRCVGFGGSGGRDVAPPAGAPPGLVPAPVPDCEAAIVAAVMASPGAPPPLALFLWNTFLNQELMAGGRRGTRGR